MPDGPAPAYAWLMTDKDGQERVPAYKQDGMWMPMIGIYSDALASSKAYELAQGIAKQSGCSVRLVRWNGPVETLVRMDSDGQRKE